MKHGTFHRWLEAVTSSVLGFREVDQSVEAFVVAAESNMQTDTTTHDHRRVDPSRCWSEEAERLNLDLGFDVAGQRSSWLEP